MKLPIPYFKDVPEIGDLSIDKILFDYDYPLLFICSDNNNNLFLCDCCDVYTEQRWLIAPISINSILLLLQNKLSIRDAFINAEGRCCVATWSKGDKKEKYYIITSKDFQDEDLPEFDAYIDADENEYLDYINLLEYRNIFQSTIQNREKNINSVSKDFKITSNHINNIIYTSYHSNNYDIFNTDNVSTVVFNIPSNIYNTSFSNLLMQQSSYNIQGDFSYE